VPVLKPPRRISRSITTTGTEIAMPYHGAASDERLARCYSSAVYNSARGLTQPQSSVRLLPWCRGRALLSLTGDSRSCEVVGRWRHQARRRIRLAQVSNYALRARIRWPRSICSRLSGEPAGPPFNRLSARRSRDRILLGLTLGDHSASIRSSSVTAAYSTPGLQGAALAATLLTA